jgi:hypothetical protein
LRESLEIAKGFNALTSLWKKQVIDQMNIELRERFPDPTELSAYLDDKNLIDLAANGKPVGWSYTVLMHEVKQTLDFNNSFAYRRVTLRGIFADEVNRVLQSLERLSSELTTHTDSFFDQREPYLNYTAALTEALANMDPDLSVPLWQEVDVQWMSITGPIQMVHPFESYLDNIRSTVGLQFDVRMKLCWIS